MDLTANSDDAAISTKQDGQSLLPEDALLFIQFPTTLPLANATTTLPKGNEDVNMEDAEPTEKRSKMAVKEETQRPPPAPQQEKKSDDSADEAKAKAG